MLQIRHSNENMMELYRGTGLLANLNEGPFEG